MKAHLSRTPLALTAALLCLASACTAASQANGQAQPAPPPAPSTSDASSSVTGESLVATRCGVCHPPAVISAASHTSEEWVTVVQTMRQRGAKLTDQEEAIVIDYLSKTYGVG